MKGRGEKMKRFLLLLMIGVISIGFATGCSSSHEEEMVLDSKHSALPEFVTNSSEHVQETYVMASEHHDVLNAAPCYCNCYESAGHMSNLDCFVDEMGPNNEVTKWDPHGTA